MEVELPLITAGYASLLAAYYVFLTKNVIALRGAMKVAVGDGTKEAIQEAIALKNSTDASEKESETSANSNLLTESKYTELTRAVRAHGNFAEFVPLAILLLVFAEINGLSRLVVHAFGALLCVARVLHANKGMYTANAIGYGRVPGVAISLTIIGLLIGFNVYSSFIVPFVASLK